MKHRYSKYLSVFVIFLDLLILNLGFFLCFVLLQNHISFSLNLLSVLLAFNIVWLSLTFTKNTHVLTRPLIYWDNIQRVVTGATFHVIISSSFLYFAKLYDFSRLFLISNFFFFCLILCLERVAIIFSLNFIRIKGYNKRKVLLIGDIEIINRVQNSFVNHPEYGYNLITPLVYHNFNEYSTLEIKKTITFNHVDEIYVCYKEMPKNFLFDVLDFEKMGVKIKMISDLEINAANTQLLGYDNVPVIRISSKPFESLKVKFFKRSFDLIISLIIMIAGMPFFTLIFLITKFTSKGPAFYKQQRIGINGKPFYIYKFRSMYTNAEHLGPQLSKDNDPRITPWGRIMRKTRLDELPQFFNVLMGNMSIVGPRPERRYFIEKIIEKAPEYKTLLSVKPGITSIGQVKYGYAENVEQMIERMKFDIHYLRNPKLKNDVGIILETVRVMVQGKGK